MRRPVFLSTFLFAALLSPVVLQSNTCIPAGNAKLAVLELRVGSATGENMIKNFSPNVIAYQALMPVSVGTAVLRAQPQDKSATIEVRHNGQLIPFIFDGYTTLSVPLGISELTLKLSVNTSSGTPYYWTYVVSIRRGDLCEGVACDDHNECTEDMCNSMYGSCEYAALEDGTPCAEGKGGCYGGLCNFVPLSVTVGPKEVVFDWTTDSCEKTQIDRLDIPDGPARFVRTSSGQIVLFSGNFYLSRGSDFDALQRVCEPVFQLTEPSGPESYENNEWLWSPYRLGATWHVLIHNEYHDPIAPTCQNNSCWYNSITYAVSTDSAYSFIKPGAPAHVVAPAPNAWVPPPPSTPVAEGYFNPSNIIRGADGFYYTMFMSIPVANGPGGTCVMRTQTLSDPASWRAWDGADFSLPLESPYVTGIPATPCTFLWQDSGYWLPPGAESLTYNSYIKRYMWVSLQDCGVYGSLSSDLVHWSDIQLLIKAHPPWCDLDPNTPGNLEPVTILYPSIIDHQDSTPNFEHPGRTPYLYYTRFNDGGLDRDLVRVPLKFTMSGPLCEGVDCDDQSVCTEDICNGADGSCEHTPVDCDDQNDCTIDTCNSTDGCEHAVAANGTACAGGLGACQDGSCSATFPCAEQGIRDAIAAGGGPHTFDCATPTTVVTADEIVIDNDVILDGRGQLTVDGNQSHRVFSVNAGTTAELIGFTVTGGAAVWQGAGIMNNGTLMLTSTTVSGNSTDATGEAGGIYNAGSMTVTDTSVRSNTADYWAGGFLNGAGATATLTRSIIDGNNVTSGSGGGIVNWGTIALIDATVTGNYTGAEGDAGGVWNEGSMTATDTYVGSNTADYQAGGVLNMPGATATLTRTIVEGNNVMTGAGGGIVNHGTIEVVNTTVVGNQVPGAGGGIVQNGLMALMNSTVSNNIASWGGGLFNGDLGSLEVTNTTISGNSSSGLPGGGIVNEGMVLLINTTVAANLAADVGSALWNTGQAQSRNTLIVGDCGFSAPLDSLGGNIESEGSTCGLAHPTDLVGVPANALNLGPLADNGGPTATHALLPGSIAIDVLPAANCVDVDGAPLTTDQRGEPRPEPGGTMCDVGAFELQP